MFLFTWLFSLGFWAVYFILSLFVGTFNIRKVAPETYESIKTGKKYWSQVPIAAYVFITILNYIFWPIITMWLLAAFVFKIFVSFAGPILRNIFLKIDSVTPNIEIKKKD